MQDVRMLEQQIDTYKRPSIKVEP